MHAPTLLTSQPTTTTLRLSFGSARLACEYAADLAALFGHAPTVTELAAVTTSGALKVARRLEEVTDAFRHGRLRQCEILTQAAGATARIVIGIPAATDTTVTLALPVDSGPASGRVHLRSPPHHIAAIPQLVVATRGSAFHTSALHGLVALAFAHDANVTAAASDTFHAAPASWAATTTPSLSPVTIHSGFGRSYWAAEPTQGSVTTQAAPFQYLPAPAILPPNPTNTSPAPTYVAAASTDPAILAAYVTAMFQLAFPVTVVALEDAPHHPADVVTPEPPLAARIIPTPDSVVLAIDLSRPEASLTAILNHVGSHLALGHVRPGDAFGHWDTLETATTTTPRRHWDQAARAHLAQLGLHTPPRRVASLAECTPNEKAWLVLYGHIGQMIGETRALHPAANTYQAAAYQRQAAARLVAQLEDYGGAMLCDGVGLGKTYVATTVLVHYANAWRDRLADLKQSATSDPFRITILAPNSVVSTWRREAIPSLASHGVPGATIRVISHTKLSRILPTSDILTGTHTAPSDMEHLLLSDLVIVDEAHNFRSVAARRTVVLRDLLRLQPRKNLRRKVLLLTATPVNNSLEDLRQQISLLFAKPLWFNDNSTDDGYRARTPKDVADRIAKARAAKGADVAAILIHGSADARFSVAIDFRDDLQLGVQIPRVGDYLKEQEKLLLKQQDLVRAAMQVTNPVAPEQVRIASELLDRIVVQRSRALCKQIEREQGSNVKLLFRPDAPPPEKLIYEDVYDDTHDVLASFLPLFDTGVPLDGTPSAALSLKVYMWSDVRDGTRDASETSSVVGLQRVLVLKRLESSPVAFLITLLRLLALHAHRLSQLVALGQQLGDRTRADALGVQLDGMLNALGQVARDRLDLLITGDVSSAKPRTLLDRWSKGHLTARPAAGADDPPPPQLELFEREDEQTLVQREQFDRLWAMSDALARDFKTLLGVAPGLADIVFGRFERADWPQRFIAGGANVDWPASATWGLRIVTDAKLKRLIARLLRARKDGQKVIVFSQFTDTLAYVDSVLQATRYLARSDWRLALGNLVSDEGFPVTEDDVRTLAARTAVVSGETDDRDAAINAFAPFYRLGPMRPGKDTASKLGLSDNTDDAWVDGWTRAMEAPVDVLLASDVLAEGVNLQDAALLINYDVHWNPVRMIQRAGRVDRRLNPAIEETQAFPDLEKLAVKRGKPVPRYWWHDHPHAAPVTVNLLLPDELEDALQLRERIANKTLAIDFTLGLEQGTGAEAEWMADYRYQGISALNVWQKDRAIERVAGYHERLKRLMAERAIVPDWLKAYNGWLREPAGADDGPIVAWARLGRKGGELADYTRYLVPKMADRVPHWLWTTAKPSDSVLNFWMALDGKVFPASTRQDLGFDADASRPLLADDLLTAAIRLVDDESPVEELGPSVGRPVQQGISAISAGFLMAESDRRAIDIKGFRLLQLARAGLPAPLPARLRRGIARACATCGHAPGMHKCCPKCGASAATESAIDAAFGFRRMRAADGTPYEVPQPWCRACRSDGAEPDPIEDEEPC